MLILGPGFWLAACTAFGADSAAIFLYHHVDDNTPASTSVLPSEFRAQLDYLEREGFSVLPLIDLLDALHSGRTVPERSVAITFDDAYVSILGEALPILQAHGWPFTVFVNTQAIDDGYGGYLSWDELRWLRELPGESTSKWRQRVSREITAADERLRAEVGDYLIPVFAYPYGEYTSDIKAIVAEQRLYGLGQQSGAIGPRSDFLALPRYPIATGLELEPDFALRAVSRPLPVMLVGTERHVLDIGEKRPPMHLKLGRDPDIRLADLACYASGQGLMALEWQDEVMREFIARPERDLDPGRSKYNCTAPSRSQSGVYYWYGYLWMARRADGSWYDE
jgi:biofilm PGA synthesis lipoprotein PgaB